MNNGDAFFHGIESVKKWPTKQIQDKKKEK